MSKLNCLNCHFLAKACYPDGGGEPFMFSLKKVERDAIKKNDFTWVRESDSLFCYHGVWDEGLGRLNENDRYDIIVNKNRKDFCFYWKYKEGMMFKAASTLQERNQKRSESVRELRIAIIGLWIAALGLIANVIIEIIKFINKN